MIKKIVFILLFISSAGYLCGQHTPEGALHGRIHTADGQPAETISITLKGTTYGATTDDKGFFSLSAPAGSYTMVVYSITAHMQELPVSITAGVDTEVPPVTIFENKHQLQEVVITGQFSPQSLRNSVYKMRVINKLKIEEKAATNVQNLLNTELGVRLSNDMALGETDFELMGMSGRNVKVLLDGVPLIDRDALKQSLSQIDINTIERVEIVEGPMSVMYGSDALAGVINVITKKTAVSSDKNRWNITARVQEESAGNEYAPFSGKGIHNENISLSWAHKKGFYAGGGFSRDASGGWKGDKPGRETQWQPKDQYLANGTIGYKHDKFHAWYRLDYLDETIYTALNALPLTPNEIIDRDFETDRFTHQLQAEWRANHRLWFNLAASYQDYERRSRTVVTDTLRNKKWLSLDPAAQDTTKQQVCFARATATWRITPELTLQPGLEYQWNHVTGGRIKGQPEMTDVSVFVSAEWTPWKWLNVRPGLRSVFNSVYSAPPAIPSLNTKIALAEDMDLRLSYAYGFRAPTLRELYFSFHNANHNIDGNPELKAEYSNNVTGSFVWRILHGGSVRLTSALTGFYNDFNNRIVIAADKNDPAHNIYDNVDKYKTTGGTFEILWHGKTCKRTCHSHTWAATIAMQTTGNMPIKIYRNSVFRPK